MDRFKWIVIVALLAACSDTQQDLNGDPWAFQSDAGGANDTPNSDPRPIDAGRPRPCDPGLEVQLVEGPLFNDVSRPIAIANDAWWFLRGDEFGGQQLTRQYEIGGDSEMFRRDVVALLGAGEAGVLFIADGSIILLDPESGEERRLAPVEFARPWETSGYETAVHRFVGTDTVSWAQDGIWIATATDVAQVAAMTGAVPYVRDGSVAFAAPNEYLSVWDRGRLYELLEPNPRNVALSRDDLFFVRSGGGLFRAPRADLATAQPVPVLPPDTNGCNGVAISDDGTEMLASCSNESDGTASGLWYSTDGENWTLRVEAPGDLLHTYAVGDGWIAWANYNNTPPVLVVVSPGGESVELGPINTACLSCGAYWPPNYVQIRDGKVAWNYATGSPGGDPSFSMLGMAELCTRR